MTINVLLADDQALVRGALATLLGLEPDIEVVAQVGTGRQVVEAVRASGADVALLDIDMPDGDLSRAMEAGASGFIVKDTPPQQLADAVRKVHAGLRVIDPSLAQESVFLGPNPLTEREQETLREALTGSGVSEIAKQLHLSEGTVRNYLSSAIGKTNSRNRTEAARVAETNGWL